VTFFLLISFTPKSPQIEKNSCTIIAQPNYDLTLEKFPSPPKKSKFEDTYYALNRTKKTFSLKFSQFFGTKVNWSVFFWQNRALKNPTNSSQKSSSSHFSHVFWVQFWSNFFNFQITFLAHIQCNILQPTNSHHVFWFASHTKWKKSEQNVQSLFSSLLRLKTWCLLF